MLKEFENWIEVSTNGDRKVSQQLINALSAANWKDLNFDSPENIVIGGDLYVSGVKFDSSTNTFTFTMSDGTTVIAKVGSSSQENITLENDKGVQGKGSNGDSYNLIKVSSMNTTEVGSTSSPMNLNSSEIPTIQIPNQSPKTLAISTDIEDINSKIITVNENLVQSINSLNKNMADGFNTINGGINNEIRPEIDKKADSSDVYTKAETDERIQSIIGSAPEALDTLKEIAEALDNNPNFASTITNELTKVNSEVDKIKSDMESQVESINQDITDINNAIESNIKPELEKSVKYNEFTYNGSTRKTIQLDNYDSISGLMTDGSGVNIAMVSKWDTVDLGSPSLPINFNTPMGVRPTVQERGQSGEEANKIAYVSDVEEVKESVKSIKSKVDTIEDGAQVNRIENIKVNGLAQEIGSDDKGVNIDLTGYATKTDIEDSVKYQDFVYGGQTRKTIQLPNYDSISSVMTNGTGVNIAMVNKWDVVDLGSPSLPINLNTPSGVRPTVQEPGQSGEEAYKVAYTSDLDTLATKEELAEVESKIETGGLNAYTKEESDEKFVIKVSGKGLSSNDFTSELKSKLDSIDLSAYYTKFESDEKYALKTDITDHIDAYTKSESDSKYVSKENGKSLSTNDYTNEDKSELVKLRTDVDYVGGRIDESNTNTAKALDLKVSWDSEKKVISLPKDGSISALRDESSLEGGVLLAQRTYDDGVTFITEVGTTKNNLTLNSSERPQIDLKGLSSEKLAYESDSLPIKSDILSVISRLNQLEDKLSQINKTNIEPVVIEGTPSKELDDQSKDYKISGNFTSGTSINISGKSVQISNTEITDNTRLSTIAKEDIDIKSTNVSGDFPKNKGNAVVKLDGSGYITIKDMTFNSNLYNAIEIGLNNSVEPVKGVLIDNCKFLGKFSNNAILIFGTQNEAVININNCYFENVSNAIRLSNKTNVKCTVNITNCKCDHWDTSSPWQGFLICQDYTSGSSELEELNNLFSKDKITINVSNLIGPNNTVLKNPEDMSSICGTLDSNQVFYVWNSKGGSIPYGDGSRYPKININ